jgi:adenosylmethionine-8-amino-7-oxononanoate aminotransferase
MAITNVIHQALTDTERLSGWLDTFHRHGNAFLSLMGCLLAYPTGQRTAEVIRAIRKALTTFGFLSSSLATAVPSAKVARHLIAKVEVVVQGFCGCSTTSAARLDIGDVPLLSDRIA